MIVAFPSAEFDEAVAAVCHGSISEEEARALNELLKDNATARDEYILRLEIHSRLASDPDLFAGAKPNATPGLDVCFGDVPPPKTLSRHASPRVRARKRIWTYALAIGFTLAAIGGWGLLSWNAGEKAGTTSNALAMLDRVVDAEWMQGAGTPRLGAPLGPGWFRLKSGLAQVVFYSGARVAIQGPAEIELISQSEAMFRRGRLTVEVPPQARGFRVITPQMSVTDLGTSFGLEVTNPRTELHVFIGSVEFTSAVDGARRDLQEGSGAVIEDSRPLQLVTANPQAFASLFELRPRSVAAEALRYDQWREASQRLNSDPSLLVHLDFETGASSDWQLRNRGNPKGAASEATIVGCQWTSGRWPDKRALEFQSVNDRVRLSVLGEFEALTIAAWVRVQGLDRKINSLFMSDGFEAGTIHWVIRNDGVLGLTVIGPGSGRYQIITSDSVLTLDQYGMWHHLAVVLDGKAKRVVHYVNGLAVGEKTLKIDPPYRVGATELGNWNARVFPDNDPFLIRNFSGAMDELCLFTRALNADEVRALYSDGKPQSDPAVATTKALRTFSHP